MGADVTATTPLPAEHLVSLSQARAARRRVPVALRAWLATEDTVTSQVVTRIGEDALELRGAVSHLVIGSLVAVTVLTGDERPLVLSACVHRAERGRAVLWIDEPAPETEQALRRFLMRERADAVVGAPKGSLFTFLHAA